MRTVIKQFDERKCMESGCTKIFVNRNIPACFGIPEECEFNKKNGYPKEVDESEMYNPDN